MAEQVAALAGHGLLLNWRKRLGRGTYGTVYAALPTPDRKDAAAAPFVVTGNSLQDTGTLQQDPGTPRQDPGTLQQDPLDTPRQDTLDWDASPDRLAVKVMDLSDFDPAEYRRALRELRILSQLRHPNIVRLAGALASPDLGVLGLVFARWDNSLGKLLRSRKPQITIRHVQYLMLQLLAALEHLHGSRIIHGDVKPENILLNNDCALALTDFGMAISVGPARAQPAAGPPAAGPLYGHLTDPDSDSDTEPPGPALPPSPWEPDLVPYELVQTSWYRAPEVVLELPFGFAADIWSAGCVFAELLWCTLPPKHRSADAALFPVADEIGPQLTAIISTVGAPTIRTVTRLVARDPARAAQIGAAIRTASRSYGRPLEHAVGGVPPTAIDLLRGLLNFDPNGRPTAAEALAHPFFSKVNEIHWPERPPPSHVDTSDIDCLGAAAPNSTAPDVPRGKFWSSPPSQQAGQESTRNARLSTDSEQDPLVKATLRAKLHDMIYPELLWRYQEEPPKKVSADASQIDTKSVKPM